LWFEVLEERRVLAPLSVLSLEFVTTSPTSGSALPDGVTRIGGVVLDLIGANGVRVISQLAASALYSGYFDDGTPESFQGNPGTIGVQTGFSPAVIAALGGGLRELAVRITLEDGDTGTADFDEEANILLLNGVAIGNFSDVQTQERSGDGQQVLSGNSAGGFRNNLLDTGFFYSNSATVLNEFFATLSSGQVVYQLQDNADAFDNYFDFTQGIDGGLIDIGQGPTIESPVAAPAPPPETQPAEQPTTEPIGESVATTDSEEPSVLLLLARPTVQVESLFAVSDAGSGGQVIDVRVPTSAPQGGAPPRDMILEALSERSAPVPDEIVDAVYALAEIESLSLVGYDMGDEPLARQKKVESAAKVDAVAERVAPPQEVIVHKLTTDDETLWSPLLWGALAGGGTLWAGGAWWWHGHKRQRRVSGEITG
jgi:hypothetical protein